MTEAQKRLRELRERQSKQRGRMAELSREDDLSDETRAELDTIEQGTADLERQIRAATTALEDEQRDAKIKATDQPDAEQRERIELRSKASLGRYLTAAVRGHAVTGAEHAAHGRLHVVVNAAPGDATEKLEGAAMGIEHHLL